MENSLAVLVPESSCTVGHQPFALSASDLGAQVGLVALTVQTFLAHAFGSIARDDDVSHLNASDSLSDALNDGCGFVSEDAGPYGSIPTASV